MAYSQPPDKSDGDVYTESMWDTYMKANWEASAVHTVGAKGSMAIATASQTLGELTVGTDSAFLVADSSGATGVAWHNAPAVRLTNSSGFDPDVSTWDSIEWTSGADYNDMFSSGVNITVPAGGGGLYLIGGRVTFDTSGYTSGSNFYGLRILSSVDGTIAMDYERRNHSGHDISIGLSVLAPGGAATSFALQVYTVNDVDVLYLASYSPIFWAMWQRQTP